MHAHNLSACERMYIASSWDTLPTETSMNKRKPKERDKGSSLTGIHSSEDVLHGVGGAVSPRASLAGLVTVGAQVKVVAEQTLEPLTREPSLSTGITAHTCSHHVEYFTWSHTKEVHTLHLALLVQNGVCELTTVPGHMARHSPPMTAFAVGTAKKRRENPVAKC